MNNKFKTTLAIDIDKAEYKNILELRERRNLTMQYLRSIPNNTNSDSTTILTELLKSNLIKYSSRLNSKCHEVLYRLFGYEYSKIIRYDIEKGKLTIDIRKSDTEIYNHAIDLGFKEFCHREDYVNNTFLIKQLNEDVFTPLFKSIYEFNTNDTIIGRIMDGSIHINDRDLINKHLSLAYDRYIDNKIIMYEYLIPLNIEFKGIATEIYPDTYRNTQTVLVYYNDETDLQCLCKDGWEIDPDRSISYKSKFLSYIELIDHIYRKDYEDMIDKDNPSSIALPMTFQITDKCNLRCTYCYQINKGQNTMTKETAKKVIDYLLSIDENNTKYLKIKNNPFICIEFVGGEGLMDIDLIDYILSYFVEQTVIKNHVWATRWSAYISSNGVLYRDKKVQNILQKWNKMLSISITVDGNKELHDKCRVFPDGSGSYDIAMDALMDQLKKGAGPFSKITLSPDNLEYFGDSIIDFINHGFLHIWFNAIFEHEWTVDEGRYLYKELKRIIDYIFDNNLARKIDIIPLSMNNFTPLPDTDNKNWCGGDGRMLTINPTGEFFNCTRYTKTSLGNDQPELIIGDYANGFASNDTEIENINLMRSVTRRSQSTDECFYCPIAAGCSWCSAYNYQKFGTPNKRTTTTCNIHKAQALAAIYYWGRYLKLINSTEKYSISFEYNLVKDIISEEEFISLQNLVK